MYNNEPNDFLMVFNFGNKKNKKSHRDICWTRSHDSGHLLLCFFQANFFFDQHEKDKKNIVQ